MQRYIFIVIFLISGFIATAQNSFRDITSEFKKNEQFFSSELNNRTIQLYVKEKNPEQSVSESLKKLNAIKVMRFVPKTNDDITNFINIFHNSYNLDAFAPYRTVSNGYNNQLIYMKEKGDVINNLLIVNTNYSLVSMVEIQGDIDLEKIADINSLFNIEGLDKIKASASNNELFGANNDTHITAYSKDGSKLTESSKVSSVMVNGYKSNSSVDELLSQIDPSCIGSINISKTKDSNTESDVDIMLEGGESYPYTVCEGILYFGQNGALYSIDINDDCSPLLLFNCTQKPLKEILEIEPDKIKSIELTRNPRNCKGKLDGEYVVLESK